MSQDDKEYIKCPDEGGNENEKLIVKALDGKKFSELNENLQQMIVDMTENSVLQNTLIKSDTINDNKHKADIFIEINNQKYYISVKCGKNNSVHQEPVEDFITFLESEYNIDNQLKNDIRFFIWGDGTLDGKGKPSNRIKVAQLKQKFPGVVNNLRTFFHANKKHLIERFLIFGAVSECKPDFIYYGTPEDGIIANINDIAIWLNEDTNEKNRAAVPVGGLTFQAWNRDIGNKLHKRYRGVVQVKWDPIKSDIEKMLEEKNGE